MRTNRQTQTARPSQRCQLASRTFAPPVGSPLQAIEAALCDLVDAFGRQDATEAVVIACGDAIRRKGEEAAAAGGSEAMGYLFRRVADAEPEHAARRETLLAVTWAGLPAWERSV